MSQPIVFWGAAGFAMELYDFLADAGYRLVAVFDNDLERKSPFPWVPMYHGQMGFNRWRAESPADCSFVVAIGGDKGSQRLRIQELLMMAGLCPATLIHPSAVIRSARIGKGTQVYGMTHIGAHSNIGEACIINGGANIQHECRVGDGAHIGPSAVLCGCVTVGRNAFVGAGAIVLPRVSIGADAIVGAGAVVTKDVAEGTTVLGNPAKEIPRTAEIPAGDREW